MGLKDKAEEVIEDHVSHISERSAAKIITLLAFICGGLVYLVWSMYSSSIDTAFSVLDKRVTAIEESGARTDAYIQCNELRVKSKELFSCEVKK